MTSEYQNSIKVTNELSSGELVEVASWQHTESPSMAVIQTVSKVTDVDATQLDPLQHFVDVDNLDSLLVGATGESQGEVQVTFEYIEFIISVNSNGDIHLFSTE